MIECCRTCRHRLDIKKWDYSHGGCVHEDVDGVVCTCFADEGVAIWQVGTDIDTGLCECYERRVMKCERHELGKVLHVAQTSL